MTWKEMMKENCGYEAITTFWEDFSIADRFGANAVNDTYNRVMKEWEGNVKYLTELVLVLNHKLWEHYNNNSPLAALYDDLWDKASTYCMDTFTGEDLDYYFRTTD